jgi:uncharacterized protein YbjT (DUF2867 family)
VILVTGATGFIGPAIVRALRARDEEVRCLVRNPTTSDARRLRDEGCEVVQGDMTDTASLRRAAAGCEAVVHLVSIRQGRPEQFERVMSQGTRDLVAAAQEEGVRRIVLMSALGFTEETKDEVPYYRAKWEMEQAVRGSGLEWVIFRPSFVFGRGGGILPVFLRIARLAPVTPVMGAGTQRIQPIWLDDLAAIFAESVRSPDAANRTFELGGPDTLDWNELWRRLKRAQGIRRPALNMPMGLMKLNARVTERLPGDIPLTPDLLRMMELGDNTGDVRPAVETFGVALTPLDEQLRLATAKTG